MRILFVYMRTMKMFVFSIAYLSSFIKQYNINISVKVLCVTNKEFENNEFKEIFKQQIGTFKPDMVCFSVLTNHWEMIKQMCSWIKEIAKPFILCGGYHPSLFPEEVIAHPSIDALCIGEGEETLSDVISLLASGKSLETIKNLWVRKDQNIIRNTVRSLIKDLDTLPFSDRQVFEENTINGMGKTIIEEFTPGKKVVVMNASRGCFFNCSYCSNQAFKELYKNIGNKHFIRKRSVNNLIQEMQMLAERYTPDYFEFQDELFPVEKEWLKEFSKVYQSLHMPYAIHLRIGSFTDGALKLLKESGCFMVYVGIESGNEKYRKEILNKLISNEQIKKAFKHLKEMGFKTVTYNMIGLPFETDELIKETIELNRNLKPDYPLFFSYQPLPATKLYEICIKHNLIKDKTAYGNYYRQEARLKLNISDDNLKKRWKDITNLQKEITGCTQGYFW